MSKDKDSNEWNNREIGALWVNIKQGSKDKYLTGQINNEKVILFKNKYKDENPKAPDFRVYKQVDANQESDSSGQKEEEEVDDLDLI